MVIGGFGRNDIDRRVLGAQEHPSDSGVYLTFDFRVLELRWPTNGKSTPLARPGKWPCVEMIAKIYVGRGIAIPAWPDSNVTVTIRQRDNEAIASEATTASSRRVELTGAAGPLKPAEATERIIA